MSRHEIANAEGGWRCQGGWFDLTSTDTKDTWETELTRLTLNMVKYDKWTIISHLFKLENLVAKKSAIF